MTTPSKFLVEGVGKGSIPGCMDFGIVDEVIQVTGVVDRAARLIDYANRNLD